MSLTGNQLLAALSEFLDDSWSSTSTSAGTTSTVVDINLQRFRENANEESFIRFTEDSTVPGILNLVRRVSNFTGSTLTFAPVLPQAVESGKDYQIHRWDPAKKFRALDRARILAFPQVAKIVVDETVTSDGESTELAIPSSIRRGPAQVWYEDDLAPTVRWNILANPHLTSTSSWTATSVTAAAYADALTNLTIPRVETSCVKLTSGVAGSLSQALGSTYAALMAGRRVSFGCWVYSRTAGPTVSINDDAGSPTSSTAHAGGGWQFLQVSRNISGTNASTLTFAINPLTNNAVFVERAYAGAIDRIPLTYSNLIPRRGVHRDDDDASVRLMYAAPKGRQYRMEGRTPVTALGTDVATQGAATMEVGENDQDLLISTAARILLTWEGMSAGDIEKVFPQVAMAEARFRELQEDWKRRYPRQGFVSPAW